jgi:hypothetical protein
MDIFIVLLMFVAVLIYHVEQSRYFIEVYSKLGDLDVSSKKANEPERRDLATVNGNAELQYR